MEEVRRRTLRIVGDVDERLVDWEGVDGEENSIGSLLYHIALVEMGWLHGEVMGLKGLPVEVEREFPFAGTEPGSRRLSRVMGLPLATHVERLQRCRGIFLREMAGMTAAE